MVFGNTFPIHDALVVCFKLSFFNIIRISFLRNIKCERYKGNLEIKNARKEENCLGKPWCEERMKRFSNSI